MKKEPWLTRKQFAEAYQRRWQLPAPPSQTTLNRWFTAFKRKRLARLIENPYVASGSSWEISPRALDVKPPKVGPPFKQKKHNKTQT